jgi:sRNA-binding carbon storage regulator CsrA
MLVEQFRKGIRMLMLTRAIQESVIVGEGHGPHEVLDVSILAIHENLVRLGFEVDADALDQWWEVWEHIRDGAGRPIREMPCHSAVKSSLCRRAHLAAVIEIMPEEEAATYA